ncbi:hypothetical protein D018_0902 [Vibrio parahaemolyticus VP2007-007]|nr:hypothetical protein D018_0902 [Vibrio parahaemolyticus VP2007-007]
MSAFTQAYRSTKPTTPIATAKIATDKGLVSPDGKGRV